VVVGGVGGVKIEGEALKALIDLFQTRADDPGVSKILIVRLKQDMEVIIISRHSEHKQSWQ